ncbi:hypothetical protein ACGFY0_00395 [Streptomyces chartreusis]|uniref:hypothetical protein n=1 Tax=Streptomyces chartreusis TaxID=1969 RepID=UPI0037188C37
MARKHSSDEQHLLELVSLLPGWEADPFWNSVAKVSGYDHAQLELNTALSNAVSPGNCMSLAHVVLGIFGQSEHRAALARLIGGSQTLVSSADRSGVGEQWLKDALPTAWRIWLHYSGAQDEDPLEVLSRNWELPELPDA